METDAKRNVSEEIRNMESGESFVYPLSYWERVNQAKLRAIRHHKSFLVSAKFVMTENTDGTFTIKRV